jgi:hypothetical protein
MLARATMVEGMFVKRGMICAALMVLALSAPAAAQGYGPGPGYGPGYQPGGGGMPPREVFSILRSRGLDPFGPPMRRGPNYVLRAIDNKDREVTVVVSARSGDVLSVTPVQTASRMPPPRGGFTYGPYERMPPGYMPRGGYRAGAPAVDEDDEPNISGNPNAPRPPGGLPGAPPARSSNAAPPPDGAMQPDGDDASPQSEPNVITADPDRSGLLPPPPERFPQRAAPSAPAKPKPVQRAAAAPPKQAPLPRPKPAAKADAPPISAPAQAAPDTTSPKAPATEETPH